MSSVCQEVGTVVDVGDDGYASVRIHRVDACHTCEAKGACHALGGAHKEITLNVENTQGARPGDRVVLSLPEVSVITASATVYLVPAAGLVVGAVLGPQAGPAIGAGGDDAALIGAGIGLLLGLGLTRIVSGRIAGNPRYVPTMVSIESARERRGG